jgi:hypothetical protein
VETKKKFACGTPVEVSRFIQVIEAKRRDGLHRLKHGCRMLSPTGSWLRETLAQDLKRIIQVPFEHLNVVFVLKALRLDAAVVTRRGLFDRTSSL